MHSPAAIKQELTANNNITKTFITTYCTLSLQHTVHFHYNIPYTFITTHCTLPVSTYTVLSYVQHSNISKLTNNKYTNPMSFVTIYM